jgi:hypothetical protein
VPKRPDLTAAATPASKSGITAISAGVGQNQILSQSRAAKNSAEIRDKQDKAWQAYDEVGEIHFLGNGIIGASVETLKWYGAENDDASAYTYSPPIEESDDFSDADKEAIRTAVHSLKLSWGSQSDLMRVLGINLFMAGEVYMLHETRTMQGKLAYTHKVIPTTYVKDSNKAANNKVVERYIDPIDGKTYTVGDTGSFQRIFRPHPAFPANADSPMFSVLEMIEELAWIQQLVSGLFRKRIMTSGILLMANSILGPDFDPNNSDSIAGAANNVANQIVEQMRRNIRSDTDSPALPILLFPPFEHVDKGFKFIDVAGDLPDTIIKEREAVLRRIANSLDVPAEYLTGLGDTNHWGAWLLRDLLWTQHIAPLGSLIGNSLTTTFLQPALIRLKQMGKFGGDPEGVKLWFQAHPLQSHPDAFVHLITAYDKGIIGKGPILRALGIPEDQAIEEDEFNLWLSLKLAQLGTGDEVGEGSQWKLDNGKIVLPNGATPSPSRERTGNRANPGQPNQRRAGEDGPSQR